MAARVLKVVRTFVELENVSGPGESGAEFALDVMRHDPQADELVLEVLEHVLDQADAVPSQEHPRTVTAQLVPLG